MEDAQKQQIDQAIQELRKAFLWRAELCAKIAETMVNNPQHIWRIEPHTRRLMPMDVPYQKESEQLDQANQLIARLTQQILTVSMPGSVHEWEQWRREVISVEQMVAFAHLDLLKPVMLDLDVLPFD